MISPWFIVVEKISISTGLAMAWFVVPALVNIWMTALNLRRVYMCCGPGRANYLTSP